MVFGMIEPARVWVINLDNVGQKKRVNKGRGRRQGRARGYIRERDARRGRGVWKEGHIAHSSPL